jgi:hypothetical protein
LGWNSALFVTTGWKIALYFSSSDFIVAHLILTLVAYIAAFFPSAPNFKSNDGQISTVCDDQYSSTIAMLQETPDEAFKVYMTCKTQGWFRCWGPRPSAAATAPGVAPSGAGGPATPARRAEAPVLSDDKEGADLILPDNSQTSPILELESLNGSRGASR